MGRGWPGPGKCSERRLRSERMPKTLLPTHTCGKLSERRGVSSREVVKVSWHAH
jgi:hypothetical protein